MFQFLYFENRILHSPLKKIIFRLTSKKLNIFKLLAQASGLSIRQMYFRTSRVNIGRNIHDVLQWQRCCKANEKPLMWIIIRTAYSDTNITPTDFNT